MAQPTYKPPESSSGDKRTPVTFFRKTEGGFLPEDRGGKEKQFFCMAEMYDSSMKDYESANTENAQYVITIIIPNPRQDYSPKHKHIFEVEDPLYDHVTFEIQDVKPRGLHDLKIVGVAYGG